MTTYNSENDTATYSQDNCIIASLDFKSDKIEFFDDEDNPLTSGEKDLIYKEMHDERQSWIENSDYDVRAEQGLYGYGY